MSDLMPTNAISSLLLMATAIHVPLFSLNFFRPRFLAVARPIQRSAHSLLEFLMFGAFFSPFSTSAAGPKSLFPAVIWCRLFRFSVRWRIALELNRLFPFSVEIV
jgi:hypothetical protein